MIKSWRTAQCWGRAAHRSESVRASFNRDVIAEHQQVFVVHDGRSAIITAGPPGVDKHGAAGRHRRPRHLSNLYADILKRYLVERAVRWDPRRLLDYNLADEYRTTPGELVTLVHDESARLIEQILRDTSCSGENRSGGGAGV